MDVVGRIQSLMDARGIKAAQLLRDTDLNHALITQWKKGDSKPSTEAIVKIAKYFNVSTDYLMTGENPYEDEVKYREFNELVYAKNGIYFRLAKTAKDNDLILDEDDLDFILKVMKRGRDTND